MWHLSVQKISSRKLLVDCSEDSNLVDDMQQFDNEWMCCILEDVQWNMVVPFIILNSIGNTKASLAYLNTFLLNLMKDLMTRGFVKFSGFC